MTTTLSIDGCTIDITPIVTLMTTDSEHDPWFISNSIANLGYGSAKLTWRNAQKTASLFTLSPDGIKVLRSYFLEYGCWEVEELDDSTCMGLLMQEIACVLNHIQKHGFESLSEYLSQEENEEDDRDEASSFEPCLYTDSDDRIFAYVSH